MRTWTRPGELEGGAQPVGGLGAGRGVVAGRAGRRIRLRLCRTLRHRRRGANGDASLVADHCRLAREQLSLAAGSPLAASHGTRYPIVQGPMTRVSDTAAFASAVATAAACPSSLALLRADGGPRASSRPPSSLDGQPWGVGVLGFVTPELRTEQMAAIREVRPPFALIAGGRPDQARELEDVGIRTYLHVPSPGLLDQYLQEGARRFVLEGRECGGHVGPRSSLVLWEGVIEVWGARETPGARPPRPVRRRNSRRPVGAWWGRSPPRL